MIEALPEWAAMLTNQSCPIGKHPDWFINSEHNHRCPWCEIDRLRLELERTSEPAGDHPMTETERIDGRIRDLAELCTRHGTPCADGLLAEIGRLRTENEQLRTEWQFQVDAGADLYARAAGAEAELERCEGDLGVAIREAAAAREALREVWRIQAKYGPWGAREKIELAVSAALDQRLAQ